VLQELAEEVLPHFPTHEGPGTLPDAW
jgi:hypothetical protein